MVMTVAAILSLMLFCTFFIWAPCAAILFVCKQYRLNRPARVRFYWRVLKWPSFTGITAMWVTSFLSYGTINNPDLWMLLVLLAFWAIFRNVGNDEPPQPKCRVRARLKQVGGRLVLVSETTR